MYKWDANYKIKQSIMKGKIKNLFLLLGMIFGCQFSLSAQNITFTTELNRLDNLRDLPKYAGESVVKQFSSYDRTGKNNDGFEGTYSFIRKNDDGSLVVFETEGKGVIERLWTPTPTDDTLDFYLDGSARPTFSIKFNDLFNGKIYPFIPPLVGQHIVGGYYSYLPIPYNNGCKIVFRGSKMLFYQFQYREYPDSYQVKTFNPMKISVEEDRELNKLVRLWNYENRDARSFYGNNIQSATKVFELKPGQTITLADIKKGGRILGIEFDPAEVFEGMNKQIDLKITWDNEQVPAVYAPVADILGYAFGKRSMRGLMAGVNFANQAYFYYPMPFDNTAKVELVYRGLQNAQPLKISSKVYYTNEQRNKNTEGKFYALWKREEPALGKPYVFLEGNGRGHYAGTVLHSQATDFITFTEFFEGDDLTIIDGEMTAHGTGSEDYFNGGWYAQPGGWVERLGVHLSGCLDYSLPLSRTGGYRFFVSDKMPFNKSIYHSMEHGPENNNRPVDYISVAMYYADAPISKGMTPNNDLTKVFVPDTYTFYSRLMDHLTYSKDIALKHGGSEFDGKDGLMKIDVADVPVGKYKAYIHTTTDTPDAMQVGIKQKNGNITWTNIANVKGRTDVFVGNAEVIDTKEPVEVYFKSNKNNKLIFERVSLKK